MSEEHTEESEELTRENVDDHAEKFIGSVSGLTVHERYFKVCQALVVQSKAIQRQDIWMEELRENNEKLKRDVMTTGAQLNSSQASLGILSNELAKGHKALETEVYRLRKLCEDHGIDPNA